MNSIMGDQVSHIMLDGHSGTGKKMDTRNLVYLVNACRRFTGDGLNTLQFTIEKNVNIKPVLIISVK